MSNTISQKIEVRNSNDLSRKLVKFTCHIDANLVTCQLFGREWWIDYTDFKKKIDEGRFTTNIHIGNRSSDIDIDVEGMKKLSGKVEASSQSPAKTS